MYHKKIQAKIEIESSPFAKFQQRLTDVFPRIAVFWIKLECTFEILNSFFKASHVRIPIKLINTHKIYNPWHINE